MTARNTLSAATKRARAHQREVYWKRRRREAAAARARTLRLETW